HTPLPSFPTRRSSDLLESKKISKTQAVTSNLKEGPLAGKVEDRNVHIGPSDHVEWLDDRKWAYVRLEGTAFGGVPLNLEYKLERSEEHTSELQSRFDL